MKRLICGSLAVVMLTLSLGCSSDKDKGIHSGKEKPKGAGIRNDQSPKA